MPSELLTERHEHTLVLTLSDPATRNTLSPQACAAGIESLNVAESEDAIRCVVLRGDGAHFCAGGDLKRLAGTQALDEAEGRAAQGRSIEQFHGLIEAMRSFPKPLIAAVEGFAAGGGFSLALACDLIVAAEDARFVMSYGRIGLTPDGGGSHHLAQRLPRALVMEMLWLPQAMPARRLLALGLVNRVTDNGAALTEALAMAARLAQMAPNALAGAKELLNAASNRPLREHLDHERACFIDNLFHANGHEGLAAFLQKRPPQFR
jgi:enoyl-CoA hydratase/carnithine racemase